MQLYLVTSLAKEENPVGNILVAKCRCHGVFTDSDRASAIADKYDGSVTLFGSDQESVGAVVLYWENPGFASG